MTERPGDRTTTGHSQHIGGESFARRFTVEPHQNLENVLQQSVRQSIQRAQDRSKDSVFRQPGCCPLFDAICDFARSTGSKVSIPLLPSDHQSLRWCNQLSGRKRHINSWCCLARRTIALACRRCRTRGSLRACCDKLTCSARSGPAFLGQPLDRTVTLPKAPHLRRRCLVLWLGSCSNSYLVDFQCVGTLRHSDFFRENILGSEATTEFSLISFPFAKRET